MPDGTNNLQRDTVDWKTDNDPMTDAQRVYLDTLTTQAGEPAVPDTLSKAEASEQIDHLRKETGLGDTNDIDTEDDPSLRKDAA